MTATPTIDRDLYLSSLHEGAHARAYYEFGWTIEVVSVRKGRAHLGVMFGERGANESAMLDLVGTGHPLNGLDPEARRFGERAIVAVLIGNQAEALLAPRETGWLPELPEPIVVRSVEPLGDQSRVRLDEADADPRTVGLGDEERAYVMASHLVGQTAGPYVWLRAEADRIVFANAAALHELATLLCASPLFSAAVPSSGYSTLTERSNPRA